MPPQVCFVQEGSQELSTLESLLTSRERRCNMMIVKSCAQAQAVLHREMKDGAPDLVMIWGGATDSRAIELVRSLRADPALGKTTCVLLLADDCTEDEAAKAAGASVAAPCLEPLAKRADDPSFWWVVVRFAA